MLDLIQYSFHGNAPLYSLLLHYHTSWRTSKRKRSFEDYTFQSTALITMPMHCSSNSFPRNFTPHNATLHTLSIHTRRERGGGDTWWCDMWWLHYLYQGQQSLFIMHVCTGPLLYLITHCYHSNLPVPIVLQFIPTINCSTHTQDSREVATDKQLPKNANLGAFFECLHYTIIIPASIQYCTVYYKGAFCSCNNSHVFFYYYYYTWA